MDFMTMLEQYKKFSNLSPEEKAEQAIEQLLSIQSVKMSISRTVYRLSFMIGVIGNFLVQAGLITQSEVDSAMEVADAKTKEKFGQDLTKAKEKAKSEILAELEKMK